MEGQVFGLSIAIAVGIIVGIDANKRGMNAFGWGFFVAMIMIVGLPWYLIVRKPKIKQ